MTDKNLVNLVKSSCKLRENLELSLEKIGDSEKSLKANIDFSQDICIGYFNDTHPLGTRALGTHYTNS